jgi:two-component system response regulator
VRKHVSILLIGHLAERSGLIDTLSQLSEATQILNIDDGFEALAFLRRAESRSMPHLILLDLQLPKDIGVVVLEQIKGDISLQHIPVIAISDCVDHMTRGYRAGANAFMALPVDDAHLQRTVGHLLLAPPRIGIGVPAHRQYGGKAYGA